MAIEVIPTDGVRLEDGIYPAVLDDITKVLSADVGKGSYHRWEFRVEHPDYPNGAKLSANSSESFGPKSKGRQWFQAVLGRKLEAGERISTADVLPLRCRVLVKTDEASGFVRIEDVLKASMSSRDCDDIVNATTPDDIPV